MAGKTRTATAIDGLLGVMAPVAKSMKADTKKVIGGNTGGMESYSLNKGEEPEEDEEEQEPDGDEDEEGDGDGDGDEDDGVEKSLDDESEEDDPEEIEKSLAEGDYEPDDDDMVIKAINASPVLTRLADGIDNAFEQLSGVLAKSMSEQENVNEALINAAAATMQMVKSLSATVGELNATVAKLANMPKPKRSAGGPGGVVEKSVAGLPAPNSNAEKFANTYGVHPSVLQEKLIKGINAEKVPMAFANVFDRDRTIPPDVWERIKDM